MAHSAIGRRTGVHAAPGAHIRDLKEVQICNDSKARTANFRVLADGEPSRVR